MLLSLIFACTAPETSRVALEKAGFTDIDVGGWAPFSCSDEDSFKTSFTAKNSNGQVVDGAVCCGWLKNCTIRF